MNFIDRTASLVTMFDRIADGLPRLLIAIVVAAAVYAAFTKPVPQRTMSVEYVENK